MSPACSNVRFMTTSTGSHSRPAPALDAGSIAHHIRTYEPVTLADIHSIIHHPRSLARPMASWRPPSKRIELIDGNPGRRMLTVALSRHRVGARAKARIRGYANFSDAAYLVTTRITDPSGAPVAPEVAEGWVRAIVSEEHVGAVHELSQRPAPTFVWVVDGHFTPIPSPASLFDGSSEAA